mgnify:CR=1 FL=1
MGFGWQELLIILIVVVVLFGGSKLAGLGKASGQAIREFKEETKGLNDQKTESIVQDAPRADSPSLPEPVEGTVVEEEK